ncbi:MAG: porin family protein [Verrucomicrobia bacterium]|nr:porin family protein [Verrucomicrobiota bacterium]
MGRVSFASLTSTTLAAAAFAATSLVTAHAADLGPMVTKAPPVPVYYNWTGFYVGVNLGGSWGRESHDFFDDEGFDVFGPSDHMNGVIGGGQIGYNWQFAPWFGWGNGTVLGIEADIQGSSQRRSTDFAFLDDTTRFTGNVEDKLEWFGTVRGRAGIAFDRVLPYVTGGWAFGERKFSGFITDGVDSVAFSNSHTLSGWTVGGGIEWAFWANWTAKFEYLYVDFSHDNNFNDLVVGTEPFSITHGHLIDNIARAGVNYRF